MKTIGLVLKTARVERKITLEEVASATKIRLKILCLLEEDRLEELPSPVFIAGFIKNYAQFLGLPKEPLLALFRRQFSQNSKMILSSGHSLNPKKLLNLTPNRTLGLILILGVLGFFTYLWFQYRLVAGDPFLEVKSPQDNFKSQNSNIAISGLADPQSVVTINAQTIQLNQKGEFEVTLSLNEGVNTITVVASSKYGRQTAVKRNIIIEKNANTP